MTKHKKIRIIQISDCHLSADAQQQWFERNPARSLEEIITLVNYNEPSDSIVIATGDLSHDGSEKSYLTLSQQFSDFNKDVYTLAGNHDNPKHINNHLNKNKLKSVSHFVQGNWLVLMLDTHVPKQEHGLLSTQQLEQANVLLGAHTEKYVLIAMHHPPIHINSAWIDKINLHNGDDFKMLTSHYKNIKAVTFGHVHQHYDTTIDNIQFFACPSTCHQFLPNSEHFAVDNINPGYRWFDLQPNGDMSSGITRLK